MSCPPYQRLDVKYLQHLVAAIYGMSPVAGAISGIIAYGVAKNLESAQGYRPWQWLFIIEGVITIAWALVVIILLPALPDSVSEKGSFIFRHEHERGVILQRTREGMLDLRMPIYVDTQSCLWQL